MGKVHESFSWRLQNFCYRIGFSFRFSFSFGLSYRRCFNLCRINNRDILFFFSTAFSVVASMLRGVWTVAIIIGAKNKSNKIVVSFFNVLVIGSTLLTQSYEKRRIFRTTYLLTSQVSIPVESM